MSDATIICGDALETLSIFDSESVQCCVTSPPYWGLRDYGVDGQLGAEKTPDEYVANMVAVFHEVKRVLRNDGTLWLNIGDTYAGGGNGGGGSFAKDRIRCAEPGTDKNKATRYGSRGAINGIKPKDLIGIPWMVAFALRADGWYLRQDIIWAKPNPMPESVRDRCTRSHEYIFLLSKRKQYHYDGDAICVPCKPSTVARVGQANLPNQRGSDRVPGKTNGPMKACFGGRLKSVGGRKQTRLQSGNEDNGTYLERGANKRSVWTVTTKPYKKAHFATFPADLIEPCILAGSRISDIVLDPFAGSGTVGQVAIQHKREALLIELNEDYCKLAEERVSATFS